MLTTRISFGNDIRVYVDVVSDYNVEGTFDPDATCDTEYFGFRETDIVVTDVKVLTHKGTEYEAWLSLRDEEIEKFSKINYDMVLLKTQYTIDEKGLVV